MNHPNRSKQQQPTHTPGPWEYVPSDEFHGPYVTSQYGNTICDCYVMSQPGESSTLNGGPSKPLPFLAEMADPNARLIAAAPDLLAALKAIYSEFKAYRPDCFEAAEKAELNSPDMIIAEDGNLHAMRGSTVVIVLGARRAIAKAGER